MNAHDIVQFKNLSVRLASENDVPEIRMLVNSAYKELADMGLNYTGTYQDEAKTLCRLLEGRTFLFYENAALVGTISLREVNKRDSRKCAYLGQFAVLPNVKQQGLGRSIMDFIERHAREEHYDCLQLDTAKPATHLVEWYQRRGYQIFSETHFEGKTYDSWLFEKSLAQ